MDFEKWDICPYNKSHVILKSRMGTHLLKCRLQHPNAKFSVCPYNSAHHVTSKNLNYHIENCLSRKELESEMYIVGEPKLEEKLPFKVDMPTCSENWDEDPPVGSYLDVVKDIVMSRPVYRKPIGMSKSEKKAFYKKEAERFENLEHGKVPSGLQNIPAGPTNLGASKWGETQDFANYLEPRTIITSEPNKLFQTEKRCSSAGRGLRKQ